MDQDGLLSQIMTSLEKRGYDETTKHWVHPNFNSLILVVSVIIIIVYIVIHIQEVANADFILWYLLFKVWMVESFFS